MGGEVSKQTSIAQTWYKRVSEISLGIGLIVILLYIVQLVTTWGGRPGFGIDIPLVSVAAAAVGIVINIGIFIRSSDTVRYIIALVGYTFVAMAVAVLITSTDSTASPYVILWMVLAAMSGALSGFVTIFLLISSNGYLIYLLVSGQSFTQTEIITYTITNDLPLLVAFIIWYSKRHKDPAQDKAFSALAQELSQVANKAEIVINAIADGVIAIDGQGSIQLINPAAQTIVGWDKQDTLQLDYRSVLKLVDKEDKALIDTVDPVQTCLRTNESALTDDSALTTTSGKRLVVSVLVSPVGQLGAGAIIVFRDITSQHKEERQQAEFISTASHEMRTPVASIEGYIGLALNPATAVIDDKARTYLEKAHESAQHLGRLFQDLLDISKAEEGRLKNDPKLVDVVSTMRDISQSMTPSATAKGLALIFKPDTEIVGQQRVTPVYYSMIDLDHVREVTSNLIENAVKYTKAGSVTIDVGGDEEHIVITINDTGIGIPAEDIPHLFQKFYRVDNTDTREIGGTGLGLYLSRRVIESVGGRLELVSELGKGSTFTVEIDRLPQVEAMSYIEKHAAPAEAVPAGAEADKTQLM